MAKDKEYQQLIHTTKWLQLRRAVLTAHPLCEICRQHDEITPATEVHHIRPVEEAFGHAERRRRMYDPKNLMAVCHDCHVRIHTEMGRCGRAANVKRTKEQVAEINKKFFG